MTAKMEKLIAEKNKYISANNALDPLADLETFKANNAAIKNINDAIVELEKQEAEEKGEVLVQNNAQPVAEEKPKFNSLAEQLRAIKNAAISQGRNVDKRLVKDEIKGVNTVTDTDGGYAIQSDFLGNILDRAFERSEIIRRCRSYTVTANSNRVNYVTLDDSNDASDNSKVVVAGGVQAYWTKEGETVTPSKPKFKNNELKLTKIMGLAYATEESLEDMPFMSQLLEDSFSDAVDGLLTNGILNGTGTSLDMSQPIGILGTGSEALVKVAPTDKEGKTIKAQDLLNMRAAIREKDWSNAVWYMHPDLAPQLPLLNDGAGNLIYMPEGGISGSQYATILGRPVVFDEFMAQKDKTGSILLANMNQYMLIRKGGERKEWSMHVEFLTDQWAFRIVMRVNGAPMFNNVWSVRNSTTKRGSFVTLDFDLE